MQGTQTALIRYERLHDLYTFFPKSICYTDSDWAGDKNDRKSTGGYVFLLCGRAVSWKTCKQDVVVTSSTKAEYVALTEAAKEEVWLRRLLIELESQVITEATPDITSDHVFSPLEQSEFLIRKNTCFQARAKPAFTSSQPQLIYADNQEAIMLSENPQFHARTKHIDIRYHYIRTANEQGEVSVSYIPTADMTADIFTKPLVRENTGSTCGQWEW